MADVENKVAGLAETSLPDGSRELLPRQVAAGSGNTVVQKTRILVVRAAQANERHHVAAQVERVRKQRGGIGEDAASGSMAGSSEASAA